MKTLVVQFSGGRTSGFLARVCQIHYSSRRLIVLFENTGKEDEETLRFVDECDKRWNLNVIWLEAVVYIGKIINGRKHIFEINDWLKFCQRLYKRGFTKSYTDFYLKTFKAGTKHKIVNFETASRDGKPYEDVIKKYGLANMVYTHCTRELKIHPKNSYLKSIGLTEGDYETAIGIRADEKHRISEHAAEQNIIYPLIDLIPVNKQMVLDWWEKQPFNLNLPERWGNCDFCFKKSINRLVELTREKPERLDWWQEMGDKYATTGANAHIEPRQIFRKFHTAQDLRRLAKIKEKISLFEQVPQLDAFLAVAADNPEMLSDDEVREQIMSLVRKHALENESNENEILTIFEQRSLFDNPEFEVEYDCFCKST